LVGAAAKCSAIAIASNHQGFVRHAAPDQAPLLGLLGRQLVAQQGQAHRARRADQARQHPGAAGIRDQAQLAEGFDEAGGLRGQHDVAGQRQVGAGAGGHAVHRADHRHRQGAQGRDQRRIEFFDRFAEVDAFAARLHGAVVQVLAGAEAAAGAGQHQHAHGFVGLQLVQGVADFAVHGLGEAVQAVRAVEGEDGDAVFDGEFDGFVGHGCLLIVIVVPRRRDPSIFAPAHFSRLRGNDDGAYSCTSKSTTILSVTGKLWQLNTNPRATS
jgi:hypothetical protein